MIRTTHSQQETEALAESLRPFLLPGDLLLLRGGLAAGKTAFVRGLAKGLGCSEPVSSPTFALIHEYGGDPPLVHADLYRLEDTAEAEDIGIAEYAHSGAVLAIEWPDIALPLLPPKRIEITLTPLDGDTRRIEITGLSQRGLNP